MKEEFLHFIWKNQYLQNKLQSTCGKEVVVLKRGQHNYNNGPDFINAQLKIDNQHWVGNIEIHKNSSDWQSHKHQKDENYNNVILHVVWQDNKLIEKQNGQNIITLELNKYASPGVISSLQHFSTSPDLPCNGKINEVDMFTINAYTDRLIVERYEERSKRIQQDYLDLKHDLNESFYRLMALAFGQKVNHMGFDMLSKRLPLKVLAKHNGNLQEIESLVFGCAGYLDGKIESEYQEKLKQTFLRLKVKYNLTPIPNNIWNNARLRPPNFPTIRLAQFSALLNQSSRFMHLLEYTPTYKVLHDLLSCNISPFWLTHYNFHKESPEKFKRLSKNFINHLIINAFVPFYFFFKRRSGGAGIELVQDVLSALPPEKNSTLQKLEAMGFKNTNALQSQAYYHLYKNYCSHKKCLNCRIGHQVLSQNI